MKTRITRNGATGVEVATVAAAFGNGQKEVARLLAEGWTLVGTQSGAQTGSVTQLTRQTQPDVPKESRIARARRGLATATAFVQEHRS